MESRRGRPHASLWVLDATDLGNIRPLSVYQASEVDSPWSRSAPGRFGANQFFERMKKGATWLLTRDRGAVLRVQYWPPLA